MNPPTLLTPRLRLTPHVQSDFEDVAALWADPRTVQHIGGVVRSRQEAWFAHLRNRGLWDMLGYGYWVIRERKSEVFVGEVGFADFMRGMIPDISGHPEAGWVLAEHSWGKGYATEAVQAAHDWLDQAGHPHSACIIDPDNRASMNVAAKVGYTETGPADYRGSPVILFQRKRP